MSQITEVDNYSAYKRRKYAELKSDPEMYEIMREKERVRYIQKKEKGVVIPIEEKSPGNQSQQRKKWREASMKYRERKREKKNQILIPKVVLIEGENQEEILRKETTQGSTTTEEDPLNLSGSVMYEKIRHIKYTEQQKRKRLINIVQDLKKENGKLKKKLRELKPVKYPTTSKIIEKGL